MKTLRVLLAAVFLLGLSVQAAAASPAAVGFVPLLTSIDPAIPVQTQTRDAMRAVLPVLMAAQARGEILEFEPSLSTGVLKILYAGAAARPTTVADLPVLADMHEAISRVPHPAQAQAQAAGPEATARFSMEMYDNCFKATGLSSGAHVIGSLRDKTGRSVALYDDDADVAGSISFGCFSWTGAYSDVTPGFKITFKEYSGTTNTLLHTYAVITPSVRYTSIDKLNSIVRGTAPAGKPFSARWEHDNWNAARTVLKITKAGTVSAAGTWAVDFGAVKIRGNDHLNMVVVMSPYFDFDHWMDVSHIYCVLGGNLCEISGFPFSAASFRMQRGTTIYSFTGRFGSDGYFRVGFLTPAGDPIFLIPGDRVSGTGVAVFPLPNMTSAINTTTDVVYGKAPPNSYFDLWVRVTGTSLSYQKYAHSNSLGNYATDFTDVLDIKGQPLTTQIYHTNLLTGNAVDFSRTFGP